MRVNTIACTEALKSWLRALEDRPGLYLIENTLTGACYAGVAEKSLRQRLTRVATELRHDRHHAALLQEDWKLIGCELFAWWATYARTEGDAIMAELWLAKLSRAWEDFGGYCQRTGENCVSASLRDTERKLAGPRSRTFRYLSTTSISGRINKALLETFCQDNIPLRRCKQLELGLDECERLRQLDEWKAKALCYTSDRTRTPLDS